MTDIQLNFDKDEIFGIKSLGVYLWENLRKQNLPGNMFFMNSETIATHWYFSE